MKKETGQQKLVIWLLHNWSLAFKIIYLFVITLLTIRWMEGFEINLSSTVVRQFLAIGVLAYLGFSLNWGFNKIRTKYQEVYP